MQYAFQTLQQICVEFVVDQKKKKVQENDH